MTFNEFTRAYARPQARHWHLIYGAFVLSVANAGMTMIWPEDQSFGYAAFRALGLGLTALIWLGAPGYITRTILRAWPALPLVAWIALSAVWAPSASKAILQSVQMLEMFVVGVGIVYHLGRAGSARTIGTALTFGSTLSLLVMLFVPSIGFVDVAHTTTGIELHGKGVYGWNSELGIAAAIALTINVCFAIIAFKRRYVAFTLINAVALALSDSATAIVSAVAGIAVFLFVRFRVVRVASIAAALVSPIAIAFVGWAKAQDALFAFLGRSSNLTGREQLWVATLEEIEKRPWTGYGSGARADYVLLANNTAEHAHNGFLQLAYETGWVGLALLGLLVVVTIIRLAIKPRESAMLIAALLALVLTANYANNFTTGVTLAGFVLYWTSCAAGSLARRRSQGRGVGADRDQCDPRISVALWGRRAAADEASSTSLINSDSSTAETR